MKKDRRGGNPRITGSLLNFLGSEELTGQGSQGFRNVSDREDGKGLVTTEICQIAFTVQWAVPGCFCLVQPSSKPGDDLGSFPCAASHGGCGICIQSNYCAAASGIDL